MRAAGGSPGNLQGTRQNPRSQGQVRCIRLRPARSVGSCLVLRLPSCCPHRWGCFRPRRRSSRGRRAGSRRAAFAPTGPRSRRTQRRRRALPTNRDSGRCTAFGWLHCDHSRRSRSRSSRPRRCRRRSGTRESSQSSMEPAEGFHRPHRCRQAHDTRLGTPPLRDHRPRSRTRSCRLRCLSDRSSADSKGYRYRPSGRRPRMTRRRPRRFQRRHHHRNRRPSGARLYRRRESRRVPTGPSRPCRRGGRRYRLRQARLPAEDPHRNCRWPDSHRRLSMPAISDSRHGCMRAGRRRYRGSHRGQCRPRH